MLSARITAALAVGPCLLAGLACAGPGRASRQEETLNNTKLATFAAGCFWGVQSSFDRVNGVIKSTVGYTGGHVDNPTYHQVCTDTTGHAEAIQLEFDPTEVSYEQLLEVFWSIHDPTTLNRQGPDVGSQYRSAVFYHDDGQRAAAVASEERLAQSGRLHRPIVTEITGASSFWPAEEYHQKYHKKHGGGCAIR